MLKHLFKGIAGGWKKIKKYFSLSYLLRKIWEPIIVFAAGFASEALIPLLKPFYGNITISKIAEAVYTSQWMKTLEEMAEQTDTQIDDTLLKEVYEILGSLIIKREPEPPVDPQEIKEKVLSLSKKEFEESKNRDLISGIEKVSEQLKINR